MAADAVLIPLHCEYFALEGLADLVGTMRRVRAALNPADVPYLYYVLCSSNGAHRFSVSYDQFLSDKAECLG